MKEWEYPKTLPNSTSPTLLEILPLEMTLTFDGAGNGKRVSEFLYNPETLTVP